MNATLEIAAPGALATIQDLGRIGWRRLGVPRSGVLAPELLRIANTLAGNDQGAPAIEFFVAGPTLKAADAPVRLGLAGDFGATLQRANGERSSLDAWRSVTLVPGDELRIGQLRSARAGIVAVFGLAVQSTLGSASTYTRARFGGPAGRALAAGDKLQAAAAPLKDGAALVEMLLRRAPASASGPVRVVLGPQADYFDAAQLDAFFAADYEVSADADRMGVRLQGRPLVHRADKGAEIITDATVPGSIQVPGNGQPIVLLADGQTAGGYPKIATVVSADLARLAIAPVGARLRFAPVSVAEAEAAARAAEAELRALLATIRPMTLDGDVDLDAIYSSNLVSGMIDAFDPD